MITLTGCNKEEEEVFTNVGSTSQANTVTDIDGNVYHTVKIGSHIWMVENLRTTKYRNGDPIQPLASVSLWSKTTGGAYCNYDNKEDNAKKYGRLYNWNAVDDARNIAPAGWHVARDDEWMEMVIDLGGLFVAGAKLKQAGTANWQYPNTSATNASGFTALPGGFRDEYGVFSSAGSVGGWWTSAFAGSCPLSGVSRAYLWQMQTTSGGVDKLSPNIQMGFSVRCVKD